MSDGKYDDSTYKLVYAFAIASIQPELQAEQINVKLGSAWNMFLTFGVWLHFRNLN